MAARPPPPKFIMPLADPEYFGAMSIATAHIGAMDSSPACSRPSASRCASSSFLSANLAPQYWHQNGCHRHSRCFGGGSCALSTRLISLVLRMQPPRLDGQRSDQAL